jgi:hypothetical protein
MTDIILVINILALLLVVVWLKKLHDKQAELIGVHNSLAIEYQKTEDAVEILCGVILEEHK